MFILIQPMYSKQELNGDSNYVHYAALIRGMRLVRPDWHFVVVFPDGNSGFKYDDDGLFRLPNVTRIQQRINTRKMGAAISYDAIWWDTLYRKVGFDVVLCNLVEIAANIVHAGEGSWEWKSHPMVVAAHHYVIHPTLPYPFDTQQHVALAQVSGGIHADWNIFNSDYCQWMFMDNVKRFMRDEWIEVVQRKSSKICLGVIEDDLQFMETGNEIPVVLYNHRLQSYKNYQDTFALLNELWEEGVQFRVKVTNSTPENLTKVASYPFVDIKLCATRDDYLRELRTGDLNVTNSQHETFCISAVESMALGQPLIAPKAITFPEITGATDPAVNYPFLFTTREEQKNYLRSMLTDKPLRMKWGKILSDHVRRNYSNTVGAELYAQCFEQVTDFELGSPADAREMAKRVIENNSGLTTREMFGFIEKERVGGRQPFSGQSLSMTKLVRLARELGATVKMQSGEQRIFMSANG